MLRNHHHASNSMVTLKKYLLRVKCGFGQSVDCPVQTMEPCFMQQSIEYLCNCVKYEYIRNIPRIAQGNLQIEPTSIYILGYELYI